MKQNSLIFLFFLFFYFFLFCTTSLVTHSPPSFAAEQATDSILVFDRSQKAWPIAKEFRTSPELHTSASGQLSLIEATQVLAALPVAKNHVWVIDLRQESHAFIDGQAVSWYATKNQGNLSKVPAEIAEEEKNLLSTLRQKAEVTVFDLKKLAEGQVAGENPTHFHKAKIQSEAEVVTSLGAKYQRFYVLDHHRPDDFEVDAFVAFIKNQRRPGNWLHFHCRGGKGRASTFFALVAMMKQATTMSFEEIMLAQQKLGNQHLGPTNISHKPENRWKVEAALERHQFLQDFYAYAKDPHGLAVQSWSAWRTLKLHNNI